MNVFADKMLAIMGNAFSRCALSMANAISMVAAHIANLDSGSKDASEIAAAADEIELLRDTLRVAGIDKEHSVEMFLEMEAKRGDLHEAAKNAINALQQIAMTHPAADDHSREMYRVAEEARQRLLAVLNCATVFE